MKVLVACEYSGTVRDAFIERGHDAISCDILPTESIGPHYEGSVFDILHDGFDLLIAFPPCTYLTYAGVAHWNKPGRKEKRDSALEFFMALYSAPIPRIAIENPVGYANTVFKKPTQIIEPYYFGDTERKKTCLWLRNLPKLQGLVEVAANPTAFEPKPTYTHLRKATGKVKHRYFVDGMKGGKDKAHKRSKTFPGIANAMAEQWGTLMPAPRTVKPYPTQ